jgi:hypothetical protein
VFYAWHVSDFLEAKTINHPVKSVWEPVCKQMVSCAAPRRSHQTQSAPSQFIFAFSGMTVQLATHPAISDNVLDHIY